QRQSSAQAVIALRLVEGLEHFGLLDPHEVARLALDVPELRVREQFQGRAITVVQAARTCGYTPHAARRTSQETDQAIRLTQRKGLQDDGFRFAGRHRLSAR